MCKPKPGLVFHINQSEQYQVTRKPMEYFQQDVTTFFYPFS
jgi:hypothetical protein